MSQATHPCVTAGSHSGSSDRVRNGHACQRIKQQALGRFPPPAVVVLADDLFAVSGDAGYTVVAVAAELTWFVAGALIAERVAGSR